jgi:hypothetical protein
MSRASAIIFGLGLATGLGLSLYLGLVLSPVEYVDTHPASLHQAYKDDYILMIAAVYARDEDIAAARDVLAALGFEDAGRAVAEAAQRFIAARQPEADLRRLARLAAAFEAVTPEMQPYLP